MALKEEFYLPIARLILHVLPTLTEINVIIYEMIQKWFLLKKVCYVQYMVSKDLLNSVHEGNIKKQRNQAKVNADSIVFVPYSELWRMKKPAAK